jgi:hypothetical protein
VQNNSFWGTIFVMLLLIGLYIVVVHSGGASKVLGSIGSVTVNETQALQGPAPGPGA